MIRHGRCSAYGSGWFVAYVFGRSHILGAVRPAKWQMRFVRPPGKPGYSRLYFGPFEIEWCVEPSQQKAKR